MSVADSVTTIARRDCRFFLAQTADCGIPEENHRNQRGSIPASALHGRFINVNGFARRALEPPEIRKTPVALKRAFH